MEDTQNSKREHKNSRRLISATSWILFFLLGRKGSTSRYQRLSKLFFLVLSLSMRKKALTAELKISFRTREGEDRRRSRRRTGGGGGGGEGGGR